MDSQSPDQAIRIERQDGVATITLDRPERRNALTPALFRVLADRFDEVAANPNDRVLVLTGAGEAFCTGADLTGGGDEAKRLGEGFVSRAQWTRDTTAAALSLHRIGKPTIAAVNGTAAGGGCNLALGCDIVFAAESARFAEIFINRGLALDYAGTWLLPRLVGLQRAKDLAFRGELIDAKEALALGLVLEVLPDAALTDRVAEYARTIAAKPPIALGLIKQGLNRATAWDFETALEYEVEAQAQCLGTHDFREAMAAWMQKREGKYEGR
ncbi:MAG: enoyl-CoA hydratase-related protein [Myxococcota bacterium]|nr:enoyl-CoA hydratase-related protein [Myxococcota bacterium]